MKISNLTIKKSASQPLQVMGVYVNSSAWVANVTLDNVRVTGCNYGVLLVGSTVYATITNSLIENNSPGIEAQESTVTMTGSTVANNNVGLWLANSAATISSSTIRNNTGGIVVLPESTSKVTTITGSAIRDNTSDWGAGIYLEYRGSESTNSPLLDVSTTTFSNNQAGNSGGAVYAQGEATFTGSVFDNNTAVVNGGALYSPRSILVPYRIQLRTTTVKNNHAAQGAGLHLDSNDGSAIKLLIYQSTLGPGNVATGDGGAIYSTGQIDWVENVTIANNQAARGGGAFQTGGGESHFFHCTIAYNQATQANGGAGMWLSASNSKYEFNLFAQNRVGTGASAPFSNLAPAPGTLDIAAKGNLVDNASGAEGLFPTAANGGTNIVGVDPLLQVGSDPLNPLTSLGGTTNVYPLAIGSPAIDAISSSLNDTFAVDQRGQARPVDGNLDGTARNDIGAVEMKTSTTTFEAETMTVAAKSSEPSVIESNAGYSGGKGYVLQADTRGATAPFVTFASGSVSVGTYSVIVRFKKAANAAIFTLGVGTSASNTTTLGNPQDAYRSSVAWTSVTMGSITMSTAGARYFKFSANSKSSSSTGYRMYIDSIRLVKTN